MCAPRKYIDRRGTPEPGTPGLWVNHATNEPPWHKYRSTLVGTTEMTCRNPADALAVPTRHTLHFTAPGRVLSGIPTGTGRAPVTFSDKKDKSPVIPGRAPAGTRQGSGRVSVKHDLIMTTVPGARQGLGSRPCSQPGRGPVKLWPKHKAFREIAWPRPPRPARTPAEYLKTRFDHDHSIQCPRPARDYDTSCAYCSDGLVVI